MMSSMKWKIAAAALLVLAGTQAADAAPLSQRAILSGTVVSCVAKGTAVKEGEVLVTVNSLAGPVPAARAEADGTVIDVRVQTGQKIAKQDLVVILESK